MFFKYSPLQALPHTEVVYYFCVFVHVLFEETHNGYVVPKRIIKQFPFPSQETQLHHGARKNAASCYSGKEQSIKLISLCARLEKRGIFIPLIWTKLIL